MRIYLLVAAFSLSCSFPLLAQNKPEREAWLRDAGFGMFIHWSMDAQLGTVISHSVVGASDDYTRRYFEELPQTFDPYHCDPERWAKLAKLAGMKYMVFTAKHHSGFCMWDTETTDFNVMNTPYGKDIVAEYIEACRKYDLAVGLYYSPEDFHFLYQEGELIKRGEKGERSPAANERYLSLVKAQMEELLTNYGDIDVVFFDGDQNFLMDALKPLSWQINPDLLITRGEIETPEQQLLGVASDQVWEACMTMGNQWQFKPTNEAYKPASQVIQLLTETRAQGGALLLNIGPNAFGELPFEQERNLTELAAWYFINHEAVDEVEPWPISHEGDIWLAKAKGENTVYATIFGQSDWPRGERRTFELKSVQTTDQTRISVLGQSDQWVEYRPNADATSRFEQTEEGVQLSVVRAQRIYNNHRWPNPIVVKLEQVEPAFIPPAVLTRDAADAKLQGEILALGDDEALEVGFLYRPKPTTLNDIAKDEGWKSMPVASLSDQATFEAYLPQLPEGVYQYRAYATHSQITVKGAIKEIKK